MVGRKSSTGSVFPHRGTVESRTLSDTNQGGEQRLTICSFWYHYGECRRDPGSLSYDGSGRRCKYYHHIGSGMQVQRIPKQWHKHPCGLDLCPQKGTAKGQKRTACATVAKGSGLGVSDAGGGARSGREMKARDGGMGTKSKKNKQRTSAVVQQKARRGVKRKRNASQDQETCFFWYHGTCKRGESCPMLHGLTDPPSFVQPPPDYMHYVRCNLDWCPGDSRHEDEGKAGKVKQRRTGAGVTTKLDKGQSSEYVDQEASSTGNQSEWFLSGFPDA